MEEEQRTNVETPQRNETAAPHKRVGRPAEHRRDALLMLETWTKSRVVFVF